MRERFIFLALFIFVSYIFLAKIPQQAKLNSASFTNASDTLSNSRLSYRAGISVGLLGSSTINIDSTGYPDNNTRHLFPNDTVCFTDAGPNGCIGNKTYTVTSVVNSTTFNIIPPLTNALDTSGFVIATQSAIHTVAFTLANSVPSNGNILVTIPAVDAATISNDGFPDPAGSTTITANNGFDLNNLGTANVRVSSTGCSNNWTVNSVTAGTASSDHLIQINRTTDSCVAASVITITIGDSNKKLINPAPANSTNRTQGVADTYSVNVRTRDSANNTIDQTNTKVAIIEGLLVSANVQESLSITVAGVSNFTPACGQNTNITTTATSVPWGKIVNFSAFNSAAQTITVSTNASSGYTVKVDEDDQMKKEGSLCIGGNAGKSNNCIQDTTCNATGCTESASQDWISTNYYGLGFSLANITETDASFLYNELSRTFSSRQFADREALESKQNIMSRNTATAGSQIYLCYRLNVSADQPVGYYFNKIRYTVTATF